MKNIRFSAILFAALTLWQTLLARYVIGGASLTQVPLFLVIESVAVFAFAALTIWLIAQPIEGITCAAKRALATGGILYVIFLLMNSEAEWMIAQYGISTLGEAFSSMPMLIGALVVKALLLVAGVVFAVLPEKVAATRVEESSAVPTAQEGIAGEDGAEKL